MRRVDVGRRIHVIRRVMRRVPPGAISVVGIVDRNVYHLGLRGFDDIDRLAVLCLGLDCLLLRRLEVAGRNGLGAQRLHRGHYVLLLREEGIAQLLHPVELVVHLLQHLRHRGQRFDRRIPGHLCHGIFQCLAGDIGVSLDKARRLDHFQRIGRGHQDLGQQVIRVKRDRCQQLIKVLLRERLGRGFDSSGTGVVDAETPELAAVCDCSAMEGEKASMSAVANAQDRKHVEFIMHPQEQKKNQRRTGNKTKRPA